MTQFILRTEAIRQYCMAQISKLSLEKPISVDIKPYVKKRTLPQNNTMWRRHGEVAAWLSVNGPTKWTPEDVHDYIFKPTWCGMVEIKVGDRIIHKPRSSTDMSTQEMSDAMSAYEVWCMELGIEITFPQDVYE